MSKKVFITGASAGFGYGTAKALAEKGHKVYATMRGVNGKNAAKAAELTSWAADGGYDLTVHELDVTDEASVNAAVAQAIEAGGVDVIINNAGVGFGGVQEAGTLDQVQALFDVNVFGVLRVNRAILPYFRARGAGRIVYVSSGLGRFVLPFFGPYNATKFALEALAETADFELAPLGITSTVVQPGGYGTSFFENVSIAEDQARMGEYGPVLETFNAFMGSFEARAKAGEMPDPSEVVVVLVVSVEDADAELPLRRPVGQETAGATGAINEVCAQVQGQLYSAMGLE